MFMQNFDAKRRVLWYFLTWPIRHLLYPPPPKKKLHWHNIVFDFSSVIFMSQEKSNTIIMQNFEG